MIAYVILSIYMCTYIYIYVCIIYFGDFTNFESHQNMARSRQLEPAGEDPCQRVEMIQHVWMSYLYIRCYMYVYIYIYIYIYICSTTCYNRYTICVI